MKLNEQRQWYEQWHTTGQNELPVERMKQGMRLESLAHCIGDEAVGSVLFLGCGQGDELLLVHSDCLVAMDLSHAAVIHARTIKPDDLFIQADGMRLPFPDSTFDMVITSEVIEHILNPDAMLAEINRVLATHGRLVITTPNWQSFFGAARKLGEMILRRPITSDGQPVDNWSTAKSLEKLLNDAGLVVQSRRGAWYFPPTGLGKRRLPDRLTAAFFRMLLPVERWLQVAAPNWGHLLVMRAYKVAMQDNSHER